MHPHIGVYAPGTTVYGMFNTIDTDGVPITLAGTPALRVYKNASTTEDDSGITLTVDFDLRTGAHHFAIDLSADATFYATGSECFVMLTVGTVDAITIVSKIVAQFSIVTDGLTTQQKADVNAEVDTALADYDAPTFTELDTRTDAIEADTQDIQARIPAALVSGRIDASAGAIAADAITAAATAADFGTEVAAALLDVANGVETGTTVRQALRAMAAVLAGNASGGPAASVFDGIGVITDRVTSTADVDGDRTIVLSL